MGRRDEAGQGPIGDFSLNSPATAVMDACLGRSRGEACLAPTGDRTTNVVPDYFAALWPRWLGVPLPRQSARLALAILPLLLLLASVSGPAVGLESRQSPVAGVRQEAVPTPADSIAVVPVPTVEPTPVPPDKEVLSAGRFYGRGGKALVGPGLTPDPAPSAVGASPSDGPALAARRPTSRGNTQPVVAIDPGHGGGERGAERRMPDGTLLVEKDLALKVALRAADQLRQAGYRVVLTRDGDYDPGRGNLVNSLQARVDVANAANADVLISIHFNAAGNTQRGTETFYNQSRPFSQDSRRLATLVQRSLLDRLRDLGYQPVDRGVKTDNQIFGGGPLYILAGGVRQPSRMPGALGEALFLSNPQEAELAKRDDVLAALGEAYATAVMQYFEGQQ